jgi:hypothetical protein
MAEATLHDLVLSYRRSGEGRERIMEKVAVLVYRDHLRYGFDDEDAAADALMKYRARIAALVDRFEDRGLSFDAYLATSLRYLARTVRRDRRLKASREQVCERVALPSYGEERPSGSEPELEMASASPPSARELLGLGKPVSRRRPRARGGALPKPAQAAYSSRLVFLAIKCAWEIDEEGIERAAASAGVDPAWLGAAIEQARSSLVAERERVERLAQRRNSSWCRQRLLEASIAEEPELGRRKRLELSLDREKLRFDRVQAELGALRIVVPNSVVARIVGVPKGTVDSGLYYLRKRYVEAGSSPCLRSGAKAMVGSHGTTRSHGQCP